MSDLTLRDFVESLCPDQPQAFELVRKTSYNRDRDAWEMFLQQPLDAAVQEFCEAVLWNVWLRVLDMEAAPSEEDELRSEFESYRGPLGAHEHSFEAFCEETRRERAQRKEEITADHQGLRQLEAALGKYGIEVELDQPLGVGEYCLSRHIAEEGPDGRLRFA